MLQPLRNTSRRSLCLLPDCAAGLYSHLEPGHREHVSLPGRLLSGMRCAEKPWAPPWKGRGHSLKEGKSIHKTACSHGNREGRQSSVMLSEAFLFSALPLRLLGVMDERGSFPLVEKKNNPPERTRKRQCSIKRMTQWCADPSVWGC